MNFDFKWLADIPPQIKTPVSLAAVAVLAYFAVVSLPSGANPDPIKAWLLFGGLVASVILVGILVISDVLSRPANEPSRPANELDGLRILVDSSDLPMYFTDSDLRVLHCNDALCALIDTTPPKIEGRHISTGLLEMFILRVPLSRRAEFKKNQMALIGKAAKDFVPHADRIEFIDNSDLEGGRYRGLFKVWAHADKIRNAERSEDIGTFVIFRVEEVDSVEEGAVANDGGVESRAHAVS
jgi:hypothetical protein